jgi:hypothetical protein
VYVWEAGMPESLKAEKLQSGLFEEGIRWAICGSWDPIWKINSERLINGTANPSVAGFLAEYLTGRTFRIGD